MSACLTRAETLAALRRDIAVPLAGAGAGVAGGEPGVLAFGDARVDAHLPGGGLPLGQLHEVGAAGIEAETGAVAGGFAAALAGALAGHAGTHGKGGHAGTHGKGGQARALLWIAPCCDLYGPGLRQYGVDPERLIVVRTDGDADTLQAMETALRSGAASVVVGEAGRLGRLAARRLQLACAAGGSTALLLRRWPHGRNAAPPGTEGNAAATRWQLRPAPSTALRHTLGPPCWQVELTHARGGRPGAWIMQRRPPAWEENGEQDADDTAHGDTADWVLSGPLPSDRSPHPVRVVAVLGDHAAAPRPDPQRRAAG